jgi:hypothetical protein
MSGFSLKGFTYMLLIAIIILSSNFEECIARRGKHWRHNREEIASLLKKKGKSHGNGHNHNGGGGTKSKVSPPQKSIPSPSPLPPPPPPQDDSPSTSPPQTKIGGSSTTFNVLDFGAKGDGKSDDTKVNKNLNI